MAAVVIGMAVACVLLLSMQIAAALHQSAIKHGAAVDENAPNQEMTSRRRLRYMAYRRYGVIFNAVFYALYGLAIINLLVSYVYIYDATQIEKWVAIGCGFVIYLVPTDHPSMAEKNQYWRALSWCIVVWGALVVASLYGITPLSIQEFF